MLDYLSNPWVMLVVVSALVAMLAAGGLYAIGRVRKEIDRKEPPASEWLTKFQELHAQGELSDEEYRTIKAMLTDRLQRELNSTDKPA